MEVVLKQILGFAIICGCIGTGVTALTSDGNSNIGDNIWVGIACFIGIGILSIGCALVVGEL